MSKQEIWFVVNPFSGRKKNHRQVVSLIERRLDKDKYLPRIIQTQEPGHATQIAADAVNKKIPFVAAIGGDGTVNEVAGSLLGSQTSLGIIPMGSGNGLARELGIPMNPAGAIDRLNNGLTRQIDACFVNDIPFFCTAGVGFDARCANTFAAMNGRGLANYIRAGFLEFWTYKPLRCHFAGNDYEVFSLTFGNARQFGNNAYIAPMAQVDDGFVDCTLLAPAPLWAVPGLLRRLFNKTIHESAYVEVYRSGEFRLKGTEPLLIHYDGEPRQLDTDELTIRIREKCLRVVI